MALHIDFETRSSSDIRGAGAARYAADRSTQVLMMGYAFDDDPVQVIDYLADGEFPERVWRYMMPGIDGPIVAHNAQFERLILRDVLGYDLPIDRFQCTAAMARANNIPASLDMCSMILFGEQKSADGKALIRKFSIPKKGRSFTSPADDPEAWQRMMDYCARDVELEREIYRKLPAWGGILARDYVVSERINDRGLGLDVELAQAASAREKVIQVKLREHLEQVTDGALKATRGTGVTRWVYDRLPESERSMMRTGTGLSLATAIRTDLLTHDLPAEVRDVMQILDLASSSSLAKFKRALERHVDGRLYGSYILDGGSTTGRYSAVGVQPQNLPREVADEPEKVRNTILRRRGTMADLKSMVRAMIVAPPGRTFVCADLSQIEGRVLPWLSDSTGGEAKLAIFQRYDSDPDADQDVYCETASAILGRRVTLEDSTLRQNYGKIPELALGFGGSTTAILRTAKAYGADISEEQADYIVRSWRAANPWVTRFWGELDRAARNAYHNPGDTYPVGRVAYRRIPGTNTLQCALPDGESLLNYHQVCIEDGDLAAMHTRSRPKAGVAVWPTVRLWHGVLAENITQAVAARVQRAILARLDAAGFGVVGHSHDEVLVEVLSADVDTAVNEIVAIVTERPSWASGLPLNSKVWHGQRYGK